MVAVRASAGGFDATTAGGASACDGFEKSMRGLIRDLQRQWMEN
jgi:hypothetical protein